MSLENRRIGVVMGGLSAEREISLKSGRAVLAACQRQGLDAVGLDVVCEDPAAVRSLLEGARVDVVFIVMHGGFGEDGRLQEILEEMSVPFTGPSSSASRLAMDKVLARQCFIEAGLTVADSRCLDRDWQKSQLEGLHWPLVVKPAAQGSSIGISFVAEAWALPGAVNKAFSFGSSVIVEEYIHGREVTVSILDGVPLPVVEIIPKHGFFDYESKYSKGLTDYVVPADFPGDCLSRIQQDALIAYRRLGCRHLSRVDLIVSPEGSPFVLEVNTIPGMTETSLLPKAARVAGMSFDELCLRILDMAILSLRSEKTVPAA